ncbi:recombination-associated protein RdgC [Aliikangiella coralliicola]|uniref:Recombination-associated protein RdgC n=1 Tax=Aliikangiella coralliicola TaxID=2592383 RepID=A0A545UBL6_9GAMM|nr:recombination-associated protein RdgC [Aliikangiella coralliicola]TQV86856.1 recombination-associated protein RdgC [Aliikangiella coralliicola]
MWFKNLHLYRLTTPFELSPEQLAEKLEEKRFQPCAKMAEEAIGWVSPIHRSKEYLVHAASGCILICMRQEQKVIPASAVKEELEERVYAIQEEMGRKVYSKEKQTLKEDIVSKMLPRAFIRSTHIFAYVDTKKGYLVLNAGSDKMADTFFELLVESIGSFGAVKLVGGENPGQTLNSWVEHGMPEGWELSGDYELKDPQDERVAKFKDNEAENIVIGDLIEDGYLVNKLGFRYKGQLRAVIQQDLLIKSIKFLDELLAENDDVDGEDELVKFDADFALMTKTLGDFIDELIQLFAVDVSG